MNIDFDQVVSIIKGLVPAIIAAFALYFGVWIKGVYKQKQRNDINEIDLSAKKIDFDTHNAPIADLVSESNKSHGADDVVKTPGDDTKGG